jgi:hypothetical protein
MIDDDIITCDACSKKTTKQPMCIPFGWKIVFAGQRIFDICSDCAEEY